jgi:hypothetical protein
MITDSPRDVLLTIARAYAELARRNLDTPLAARWDALAAELRGPSDLATSTRLLADDYTEAGYVEAPDWLRAIAEIVDGRFPCGHEPESFAAPEDDPRPAAAPMLGDFDVYRTPQTGGGAAMPPVAEAPPASGDPAPPSPHLWLGDDRRECFCLIGDDHVAEPRFEKES